MTRTDLFIMYMKSKIPYYFIALIGTFMLLDFAFVTLAKLTYTGVYTENHFKKGVDFNKIYHSQIYKNETGWKTKAFLNKEELFESNDLEIDINQPLQLTFKLTDIDNRPIINAKVLGKLLRPVTDKYDVLFQFSELEEGIYRASISFPLKGQWHIRVKANKDGQDYVTTFKIVIPDPNYQ